MSLMSLSYAVQSGAEEAESASFLTELPQEANSVTIMAIAMRTAIKRDLLIMFSLLFK